VRGMMVDTTVHSPSIEDGAWVLATNQATMAVSRDLMAVSRDVMAVSRDLMAVSRDLMIQTRDLILTYRAHRFRVVSGGFDSHGAAPFPRRGSLGGYARAARLTPDQRKDIPRRAAQARWERFRNGNGTGSPDARLGGLARAQQLTPEQRQEVARKASRARLARRHNEPPAPADEPPIPAA
jgi:hypothetical protein